MRIEKWVYGGDGLARISAGGPQADGSLEGDESKGGRVVLTPNVLPGELARISVPDDPRDLRAQLVEILEPSADRVKPPCPYFGRCGGCDYQHAPYEFQLERKVEILREQLRRVGKIDFSGEIEVVSGPPFGYRNRAQFHIAHPGANPQNAVGDFKIGYLAARSHELIDIAECPISSPRINQTLAALRERIHDRRFPRFLHEIEVFTNETEVQLNPVRSDRPLARSFYDWMESVVPLEYPTKFGNFRVSPRAFFQINRFLIEALVDHAIGNQCGEAALDLYAGVGLFAIPLARKFKRVTAVESGSAAIRDLEVNVERAQVAVRAEQARVEDFLARLANEAETKIPDFVLADPPRAGLGKSVAASLNRLRAPRLTIVSCDPSTLARDLAGLRAYSIEKLALVDLFPQTYHLETIAQLQSRDET